MKSLILSVIAAFSMITTCCHAQQVKSVNMADSGVRIMGRAALANGTATLGFPGQEIELKFSGSSSVKLSGEVLTNQAWFNVYIDGVKQPVLEIKTGKYSISLADKLDAKKEHLVRIVRRNESWQGVVRVDGFALDNGAKVLPADPLPTRKIMAIGDSITCGCNSEAIPPATPGPQTSNGELCYAWLLAKDFHAQIHLVSYGGKGVMRDWRGLNSAMAKEICTEAGHADEAREIVTAPDFFERALPDDATSVWDHSKYVPDLILICLGQNDFSQIEIPPSDYAAAYIKFIDRIHAVYPKAQIVLMSSPMAEMSRTDGWMPRGSAIELALTQVNQHYIHKGELFLIPVFMNHQPGTELDSHPVAPQHRAMTDELKPVVKALLGW